MARTARKKSESGIYHVIIRGIGKQILFEDEKDRAVFLALLRKYRSEQQISVYCYCLMDNHVHLLLYDSVSRLDVFMKKTEVSYAVYYNSRYDRSGSLFQNRYKSEPVENDAYFATVFRYILKNPEKAGICPVQKYAWSSYSEYETLKSDLTDCHYAIGHFGSRQELLRFVNAESDDNCLDISPSAMTDTKAHELIRKTLSVESGTILQSYNRADRDRALRILKSLGLSARRIERLTGINRGVIQKA